MPAGSFAKALFSQSAGRSRVVVKVTSGAVRLLLPSDGKRVQKLVRLACTHATCCPVSQIDGTCALQEWHAAVEAGR